MSRPIEQQTHRRRNPLTGEKVLISPQRASRPWQGKEEIPEVTELPEYDENCYLCAGNTRANGETNPDYSNTFAFNNDFPAIKESSLKTQKDSTHELLQLEQVSGTCRVICFSPKHHRTLAELSETSIGKVIECWIEQLNELKEQYCWVQIFENKGELMGCSNAHPHGQIWAQDSLPSKAELTDKNLLNYYSRHSTNLLLDYAQLEIKNKTRIVEINEDWVALVPYWACWPYEVMIIPLKPCRHLDELNNTQQLGLASVLKSLLCRFDNLFNCRFPYSMGWHGQPFNNKSNEHWQLHAHFYPPLLHSASVKKFMVGYEMLAEPQRDITPEQAAERLRECSNQHYSEKS